MEAFYCIGGLAFFLGIGAIIVILQEAYVRATRGGISGAVTRSMMSETYEVGEFVSSRCFIFRTNADIFDVHRAVEARLAYMEARHSSEVALPYILYKFGSSFSVCCTADPSLPGFRFALAEWRKTDSDIVIGAACIYEFYKHVEEAMSYVDPNCRLETAPLPREWVTRH